MVKIIKLSYILPLRLMKFTDTYILHEFNDTRSKDFPVEGNTNRKF